MPEYIYLTHPLRDGFFKAPTVEENAIMEQHFQYLEKAATAGRLVLAGPCLDDTFGVVIFHSDNDQSARAFMFDDPAVRQNVMMAELHPMRISLQSK